MIEFFGLPGSGKSYLADKKSNEEGLKILKIHNRFEKYFFALLFFVLHPFFFLFFIKKIVEETKNNPSLLRHKIFFLYFDVAAKDMKSRIRGRQTINDQGIFQFILSIYERKINQEDLCVYRKYLKRDQYFIYIVETDHEIRKKRMQDRRRIPRKVFGEEYVKRWSEISEHNFVIIKDFILANFEYKVLTNN